jgi:WD40 repeat protein
LIVAWGSGIFRWPRSDSTKARLSGRGTIQEITFGPPQKLADIGMPTSLSSGTPREHLVFEQGDVWHAISMTSGEQLDFLPPGDPRLTAISSDDRFAAVAGWNVGGISIWDTSRGTRLADLTTGQFGVPRFSPDGQWLATSASGVQLWRTADWSLAHRLNAQGTTPHGLGIGFSADSRMLAIGEPNGEVRLIDPRSGTDVARIMHPVPQSAAHLCFTGDHRRLVALPADGKAPTRIWNLRELREALRTYKLDWPQDSLNMDAVAPADSAPLVVKWLDGDWISGSTSVAESRD